MSFRILTVLALSVLTAAVSACSPGPAPEAVLDLSLSTSPSVAAQLPGSLSFSDRMGTAQVAELPSALAVAGAPTTDYRAGDVAYAPAERSLVVFLTDGAGEAGAGLVMVGRVEGGLSELSDCVGECTVAITSTVTPTAS